MKRALVMFDMPFGSYQVSREDGVRNAIRAMKFTECDAVKMEGGQEIIARAENEARLQSEKMLAAAKTELEQKRRRAEETMAVERANALRDMKSEIATLVIDAAAKAVGDRNTEEQDKLLYDQFIAEAGEAHGGKTQ